MLPMLRHLFIIAFAGCLSVAVYAHARRKWAKRRRAMEQLRNLRN